MLPRGSIRADARRPSSLRSLISVPHLIHSVNSRHDEARQSPTRGLEQLQPLPFDAGMNKSSAPRTRRVRQTLRKAWELDDDAEAERLIRDLAKRMQRELPGVSGSILEGLDEVLTVTGSASRRSCAARSTAPTPSRTCRARSSG